MYLVPDAARILRLPVAVLRSWVAGTMERGPGADGRQEGTGGNLTERKAWKGFQRKFLSFRRFWTQQGATRRNSLTVRQPPKSIVYQGFSCFQWFIPVRIMRAAMAWKAVPAS